jgi:hypothetical protein
MSDARVLGSAADLRFLLRVPPLRFKSISGTAIVDFASALIPKFA